MKECSLLISVLSSGLVCFNLNIEDICTELSVCCNGAFILHNDSILNVCILVEKWALERYWLFDGCKGQHHKNIANCQYFIDVTAVKITRKSVATMI